MKSNDTQANRLNKSLTLKVAVVGSVLGLSLLSTHVSSVHAQSALKIAPGALRIPELEPAKSFNGEDVMVCPAWIAAGAAAVMAVNAVAHNYHERWFPELGNELVYPEEVLAPQLFDVGIRY